MAEGIHPNAPEHLPVFIAAPGEPDVLFWVVVVFVVVFVMVLGNLYLRLHSLPEPWRTGQTVRSCLSYRYLACLRL